MKVLHFTHCEDIDGINCAILGKLAFKDYEMVPTKSFAINENVSKYISDDRIYNYDLIIVTDLCIKEPLLKRINDDKKLKDKIIVLDHHESEIACGNDKYDFVNIIVKENGIKQSGTSLFYHYLTANNYLYKTSFLDTLVEWTRLYDVWQWQEKNDINPRKLHILFETLGWKKYMDIIESKLQCDKELRFTEEEEGIIQKFEKDLHDTIERYINNIKIVTLNINKVTYKVGFTHILYKYRNDINEVIMKDNKMDIDAVGLIIDDGSSVSYRQTKPNIDVCEIASYFGGKGHFAAAGNPKNNEKFQTLLIKEKL